MIYISRSSLRRRACCRLDTPRKNCYPHAFETDPRVSEVEELLIGDYRKAKRETEAMTFSKGSYENRVKYIQFRGVFLSKAVYIGSTPKEVTREANEKSLKSKELQRMITKMKNEKK